ncbi:DgyrCDS4394 [Dimorphilus gyrociliatus]|uniref:DgyrCDS4394 n=1 Tax=Dimorphilus gyrociliatus TaxID=2664684 RepID=A0A7I8VJ44_9ANNE|nr:DgyrCDS4394 [Dimorphilus gyrociliatus]
MADHMVVARLFPVSPDENSPNSPTSKKSTSYKIGNSDVKYKLPPPSTMKPYVDTQSGALDTWPAHANNSRTVPIAVSLTKDKQLKVTDESSGKTISHVPKPKFLEQLEKYLKKELQALGVTEVGPSELRLQAHREVFEYLIEDFRTYRPLLSAIKNEYEMMLSYQRNVIRQLEPLKQMIVTVSEQCDQKIMAIRDEEKQEIRDLKGENSRLYQKISEINNEKLELKSQVEKLQDELAVQYLQYRDECDERKLLITEYNNLRYEQEDSMKQNPDLEEDEEEKLKNDPVFLRTALQQARRDEASATQRLNEMIANYGDVIPRRNMEKLQKDYEDIIALHQKLKADFNTALKERQIQDDLYKKTVEERDEYFVNAESLRRSATPRPDWESCADYVAGGATRWKQLSDGKTSKQKVKVLLNEISGAASSDNTGAEYFDGLGTSELIPSYLQYEGKVRNRRLGKRDAALLIKDIWRQKMVKDSENDDNIRSNMADFVKDYLNSRFPAESMVAEWAYNMRDACQRYSHDQKIGLFGFILSGDADEELYHYDYELLENIRSAFIKVDSNNAGSGQLNREEIQEVLKEQFPSWNDDEISNCIKAAISDLDMPKDSSEGFNYSNLFTEDDEGRMGTFCEEILKLLKTERMNYVDDLKTELKDENPVSVKSLKKAFSIVDPEIEIETMLKYLSWVFKIDKEELKTIDSKQDEVTMDFSKLVQRLQLGNIRRVGRKK